MILYVRQLAWLRATPGDAKLSRQEAREKNGIQLNIPDIEGLETVIEYLSELGYTGPDGTKIGWAEIESWRRLTRTPLPVWLTLLLRTLSSRYAVQANASKAADCKEPHYSEEIRRAETDIKMRKMLRG